MLISFAKMIFSVHLTLPIAKICSMCQKWEDNCGLWVLNEMILKSYAESLKKKIMGGV